MSSLSREKQVSWYGRVVIYKPLMPQFATITELDRNGLTFIHRGRELQEREKISLDLFFTDGDAVVTDLPCRVVSEVPERIEDPLIWGLAWKCQVLFSGLKVRKHAELMSFLGFPRERLAKAR
jgi:hypothetical protein